MKKQPNPRRDRGIAYAVCAVLVFLAMCASSCVTTRPYSATVRDNGDRVGVSKQIVVLRPYDMATAIHVAQDYAGITVIDTARHRMRIRAFGTTYLTTVVGK